MIGTHDDGERFVFRGSGLNLEILEFSAITCASSEVLKVRAELSHFLVGSRHECFNAFQTIKVLSYTYKSENYISSGTSISSL